MLKVLIRKKLSKKTIFDEIISKFKKITEKKINAIKSKQHKILKICRFI